MPWFLIYIVTAWLAAASTARGLDLASGDGADVEPADSPVRILGAADRLDATAPSGPRWQALDDMPTPVLAAAISRAGDYAVITGGISQTGVTVDQVQLFNLTTLAWEPPLKMIKGRCFHAQVTLDDHRVLIVAGQSGVVKPLGPGLRDIDHCEIIDLRARTSKAVQPLSRTIAEPTVHRLADGRVLVIGGEIASVLDVHTGEWGRGVSLRDSRTGHRSVMLDDGRILVIAGFRASSLEVIDAEAGVSRMLAAKVPMEHGMDDLAAVALPGKRAWILGGQNSRTGETTDETWIVDVSDPRESKIEPGPRLGLGHGVADACVVEVGRWIVLAGGEAEQNWTDTELRSARLLDKKTQKVIDLPLMAAAHDDAVAIATADGMIIFGGFEERSLELRLPGTEQRRTFRVPTAVPAVERLILPADMLE